MVNTEQFIKQDPVSSDYNILNIVVNTEHLRVNRIKVANYNILNIVVNTEPLTELSKKTLIITY